MARPIIALMYDFDKTLSPKNMQDYGFMEGLGMSSEEFWAECTRLAKAAHMDSILAYMYLMLEKGQGKLLLRREDFKALGKSVKLFPGVTGWFDRINAYVAEKGAVCEHYIISSGLKEIIEGTAIAGHFKEIYAAEFLYRVNKGVLDVTEQKKLNEYVPEEQRRVPFRNMIYFGDGDTDVPCMKLTKVNGGHSLVVYQKDKKEAEKLIGENRVDFAVKADYSAGRELDRTVKAVIDEIIAKEQVLAMQSRQRAKVKG